jgi:hypothetical protein
LHVLKDSVTRIEERVTYIQEEQIPSVAEAAKEARDGVLVLTEKQKVNQQRLKRLEEAPAPTHEDCDSVKDNGQRISANEKELAGLSKWRWWLMGAILTAVIIAGGYAMGARGDIRAAETRQNSTDANVTRNEASIRVLRKQQAANREAIIREVRSIPSEVQKSIPARDVYDDIAERPLTTTEEETIRRILRRSEERAPREPPDGE